MSIYKKKYNIPIYVGNLKIILFETKEDWDIILKENGGKLPYDDYSAYVFYCPKKDDYVIVLNSLIEVKNFSIIAHEVVHLVSTLFTNHCIELDRTNDEPQAYLTGWFFKKITRYLIEKQNELYPVQNEIEIKLIEDIDD